VVAFYSGGGEESLGEETSSVLEFGRSTYMEEDKKLNDERFLHNTMIVLMLRFNKTDQLAHYLCKFYRFLSLSLILHSFIPPELPLSSLESFLSLVFRSLSTRKMNSILGLSLLKGEMLIKEV
jgi:hypothetical protein